MIDFADKLYRGPHVAPALLHRWGIRTSVNLQADFREVLWEQSECHRLGLQYFSYPELAVMPPRTQDVRSVIELFKDERLRPLYVHCAQGVDRTGYVVAAYQVMVIKLSFDEAVKTMYREGFHRLPYFFWVPMLRKLVRA